MSSWSAELSHEPHLRSHPRTKGSGSKGRQGQGTLLWGLATGHQTRKSEWIRYSTDRSSFIFTNLGPHRGLQPLHYLLEGQPARLKQCRRSLKCIETNLLLQVTKEPTRRGARLDLILTNEEGLVGNVKLQGSWNAETIKWWSLNLSWQ